ncbi:MAG TPA: GntR family transcriptional regulator [Bryobacteraceae bacterium]|jgi:DNA-binding transcriptional regulator YhcF (GntR family)|nr:GntR family transcriptional regulator [Bryobacteraceae bacterium]
MSGEPILRIELDAGAPAYRQIADALRAHLVRGDVKPGEILPPVRQLAVDLGIHFNTVAEAYRILAEEGWLDLRRRRGATVLDRATPEPPETVLVESFSKRLKQWVAELQASGVPKSEIAHLLRSTAEVLER